MRHFCHTNIRTAWIGPSIPHRKWKGRSRSMIQFASAKKTEQDKLVEKNDEGHLESSESSLPAR